MRDQNLGILKPYYLHLFIITILYKNYEYWLASRVLYAVIRFVPIIIRLVKSEGAYSIVLDIMEIKLDGNADLVA